MSSADPHSIETPHPPRHRGPPARAVALLLGLALALPAAALVLPNRQRAGAADQRPHGERAAPVPQRHAVRLGPLRYAALTKVFAVRARPGPGGR